jgi:hypothetical protein
MNRMQHKTGEYRIGKLVPTLNKLLEVVLLFSWRRQYLQNQKLLAITQLQSLLMNYGFSHCFLERLRKEQSLRIILLCTPHA